MELNLGNGFIQDDRMVNCCGLRRRNRKKQRLFCFVVVARGSFRPLQKSRLLRNLEMGMAGGGRVWEYVEEEEEEERERGLRVKEVRKAGWYAFECE